MQAEIVSIGTELLLGEIVDSNSAYIARALRDIGLNVYYMATVGDNEARAAEVLRVALGRAEVVIITGGLGPTADDITRQAVATATGRELEFRQELLEQVAERFRRFGSQMSENNRQQAYVPRGALAIENPVGTAPVFIVDDGERIVIALPGVPREMKHLMEHAILPWLKERLGLKAVIKARVLRTAGMGESQIDQAIRDLMDGSNPTVGLAAHTGQTDVRITAKAESEAEADALIAPAEAEIRKRLGDAIYGTGDLLLEDAVVTLCVEAGVSVASCEAGSGETLARRLGTAAQNTDVYAGGVSLADDAALAEQLGLDAYLPVAGLAEAAASAIRAKKGATLGLAVVVRPMREGDAEGYSGTAFAIATADGARSRYYALGSERLNAPIWATTHALAMARRTILKGSA